MLPEGADLQYTRTELCLRGEAERDKSMNRRDGEGNLKTYRMSLETILSLCKNPERKRMRATIFRAVIVQYKNTMVQNYASIRSITYSSTLDK